jgi:hypothetical protein
MAMVQRQPTASPPRLPPLELSINEDDEQEQEAEGTMNPRGVGTYISASFFPTSFVLASWFDVDADHLFVPFLRLES